MANHKKGKAARFRGMRGLFKPQKIAGNASEARTAGERRKAQKSASDWG